MEVVRRLETLLCKPSGTVLRSDNSILFLKSSKHCLRKGIQGKLDFHQEYPRKRSKRCLVLLRGLPEFWEQRGNTTYPETMGILIPSSTATCQNTCPFNPTWPQCASTFHDLVSPLLPSLPSTLCQMTLLSHFTETLKGKGIPLIALSVFRYHQTWGQWCHSLIGQGILSPQFTPLLYYRNKYSCLPKASRMRWCVNLSLTTVAMMESGRLHLNTITSLRGIRHNNAS